MVNVITAELNAPTRNGVGDPTTQAAMYGTRKILKRDNRIMASSVPSASPITAASTVNVRVNVMPVWNR
ncbi:hypothetical protein G6F31_015694 [Rhizopus arrhizus]|nr:hypothetical protein G6F31_015694 [Rhizopus arrhizus]